ncbi:hypothetical protein FQN53_007971 [Emmonsiellopsis sp. PD_33]|nr:hypothetical protein FQN53_007971 [Emmonsiellopsis sp. PD_33]
MQPEGSSLSAPKRFITTHDDTGKAIFSPAIPETCQTTSIPGGEAVFALGYATRGSPVALDNDTDLRIYQGYLGNAPGLTISDGTVLRYVDMGPGHVSPMHRTVSLDYGVVLEGEVELILDSGETRVLQRGDVAIQRGTKHAWRNTSGTEWSRMLYILQPCKPVEVGDRRLGEDLAEMKGVRASD